MSTLGITENIPAEIIDSRAKNTADEIYFNFSYAALKLLGKNLYSNAANAISELVANSIDAKAKKVYVYIDISNKANAVIEIIDDGCGMDYSELSEKYVWIGRNKRNEAGLSETEKSSLMGRKGIGKLAALYLSDQYYILSKKSGMESESQWEVNLSSYADSDFPKMDRVKQPVNLVNKDIWYSFTHGTTIRLNNVDLRRNGEKRIEALRRVFADFYLVDAIETTIYVAVRGNKNDTVYFEPVKKSIAYKNFYALFDNSGLEIEKQMSSDIRFWWLSKYEHIGSKPRKTQIVDINRYNTSGEKAFRREDGTLVNKKYRLVGWIAIHSTIEQTPAQTNDDRFLRNNIYQPNRLRLYVRNKLAVEDYFSLSPSTQTMSNYIEGEISFDILDDDDLKDIATSSRQDFRADERVELLISIVNPILNTLFGLRNKIGKAISDEDKAYYDKLRIEEERKLEEEKAARQKVEEEKKLAEQAKRAAEEEAERERKRSNYIVKISGVEDKNILNAVHSIYNMACNVKDDLDGISNSVKLPDSAIKKLERVATANQRILSISKLITKAAMVVDNNDAEKEVNLPAFVCEYAHSVLPAFYDDNLIRIIAVEDRNSIFTKRIKPLSFIMLLDNLVGNSIKASSKNLIIRFDDADHGFYRIIFSDDGDGIDPSVKDIDNLFNFGVTTTNGSGLGLYYAKKQMKELGGMISISQNETRGVSVVLSWERNDSNA